MVQTLTLFVVFDVLLFIRSFAEEVQPEQVHISLGAEESSYVVTWVTQDKAKDTLVLYGLDPSELTSVEKGYQTVFTDGGPLQRQIFIHRVTLSSLPDNQVVYYQVGGEFSGLSQKIFSFRTLPSGSDWSARLIVYGDLGLTNAEALPLLIDETSNGNVDVILHVGDFAYNMEDDNARVGDEFMRQLEPVASSVPYMTCPGNHENAYNFSNYRNRFTMPGGDGDGFFYSFNVGRAHIIAYTAEFYYYTQYGMQQIRNQYEWLKNDLKIASQPSNRKERPWIIAFGHRPMYCSNTKNTQHCLNVDNYARVGIPFNDKFYYGLEELFYQYGVDLIFYGHEHSYERMWPVYNLQVCNGTDPSNPYYNPPAPVHVVTGAAGNREGVYPFIPGGLTWSAFRSDDYGYSRLNVLNVTHLQMEQVSVNLNGAVIDSMMYIRDSRERGHHSCE